MRKVPTYFQKVEKRSGYLICLAVKDLPELEKLCLTLDYHKIKYCKFYEPDISQVTAIAISPSGKQDKKGKTIADYLTQKIPLAGKAFGTIDKNNVLLKAV